MCKDITKPCREPPYVTDITKSYSCILEQYIKGPPYVTMGCVRAQPIARRHTSPPPPI
jgi:hypothetical protein